MSINYCKDYRIINIGLTLTAESQQSNSILKYLIN